jgi:hypothetical protein
VSPDPWNYTVGLILLLTVGAAVALLFVFVLALRLIRPLRWPRELARRKLLSKQSAKVVSMMQVTETMCRIELGAGQLSIETYRQTTIYKHRLIGIIPMSRELRARVEKTLKFHFSSTRAIPRRVALTMKD